MHRKIQELAAGKCDSRCPILQFSTEQLEFEVLEGKNHRGEFLIKSTNEVPMRGLIYSSNPRMECHNPRFQGTEVIITYEFHSDGMIEGDAQKGSFYIICNEGEYDLPFSMSVSREYPESSNGRIKSIFSFANLAQKSYEEAVEVFGKPEFLNIFKPQEEMERLIYQSLKKKPCTMGQVEEFLIAAKKKKRITFTIEEASREFYGMVQNEKQHITLKKDNWGYLAIEISSDATFLRPEKQVITVSDFVGNRVMLEYMILEKELHHGKNYGRITLENQFQTEYVEICVTRQEADAETDQTYLEIQERRKKLLSYYIAFRMHQMVTGAWAKQSCEELDILKGLEPENQWYVLYRAQVLLINRQRQEAEWILESFRRENRKETDTPLYAYYLYLCTLHEPEPSYVNKLTEQVRRIYHKNQENPLLLWILLFIDGDLNYSRSRKLEAVQQQVEKGCNSPVLYAEAYFLLQRDPYLLNKAGMFERNILNWAVKNNGLTKELTEQLQPLIVRINEFHPIWYRILEYCYEKFPSTDLLREICSYCIKNSCYGSKFMKWYQLALKEELRIGGLYEAWMMSADRKQIQKSPKTITMYFQHHSSLAYRQQTMLYAAIVRNKSNMKTTYQNYYRAIEEFTLRQLKNGRMDSELAVLYREVLTPGMVTEETADWLGTVLFSHQIRCQDKKAVRVVVRQNQLRQETAVPLVNHCAYVNVYGTSCSILLEDAKGNRYLPAEEISVKPMLEYGGFVEKGILYAGEKMPYLLNYFDRKKIWQTYEEEDLPYLKIMMESEAVSQQYQEEIRPQMIAYYYDNYTGDTLDGFLLELSFDGLEQKIRGKLMELLVARGHYAKAYDLVLAYGSEILSPVKLLSVICCKIEEVQEEPDDFLIGMCRNVFLRGKYNDYVLKYMCRYFYGNLKEMAELWRAAEAFELDCYELEERCLIQYLYTGSFARGMEELFESYDREGGREMVVLAYLSQMCYKYLTKDWIISEYVFERIAKLEAEGKELNEACRLGLLKWYSECSSLTEEKDRQAERLLADAVARGKYFPFYKNLPQRMAVTYGFYDRTFLEYRTRKDARVMIHCGQWEGDGYSEREMQRMYSSIFCKSFLLFFGEKLPYYIKEEYNGSCMVTQSGQIQSNDLCTSAEGSRYDLINDMVVSWQMKDEITLEKRLDQYQSRDALVKEYFTIV